MKVAANRLDLAYNVHKDEYEKKALEVLRSARYILGNEVSSFENEFAGFLGGGYCIGVGNGLEALRITMQAMDIGEGDEVIIQGNTFVAGFLAVCAVGAKPVICEPRYDHSMDASLLPGLLTERTKAVLLTHLYGLVVPPDEFIDFCRSHGLYLIEDCAQVHGGSYKGIPAGNFGDAACFSFYPTKNLGAFGDAGAVFTHDESLAAKIRKIRNYGSEIMYQNEILGTNSRLDEMQAGLLRVRLKYLNEANAERRKVAEAYDKGIVNPLIIKPVVYPDTVNVWHQYVVRCSRRDELKRYLASKGIETLIHYPVPAHLTPAFSFLGYGKGRFHISEELADTVLSLPSYFGITSDEISYVTEAVNSFGA